MKFDYLKDLLGNRFLEEKIDRLQYAYDATQKMYMPDCVVLPKNTEEVSKIVKFANENKIPVVARGCASGFSGGALNIDGGIALSMELMNNIIEIDLDNLIATVEPGVVNYDLQVKLKPFGLFFPPDPSSWKFSSIGGNIAENAGGPKAVKYGVVKDWVLGLEVVLADGSIINIGSKNVKDVAGYNLTQLFVGSEGTLGIITKALLKLHPIAQGSQTLQATFYDMSLAAKTVSDIIKNKIIPSSLEFVDHQAILTVEDALKANLPTDADAILIIEVEGSKFQIKEDVEKIVQICTENGAKVKIAHSIEEEESIWLARRSISPTLKRIADGKLNEDIVVPRSKIAEMIKKTQEIAKKYNVLIVNFGHAGDGNIHTNIMYNTKDKDEEKRAYQAMDEVFDECLKLGGSISGEHGIGITKQDYLERQVGSRTIQLYKQIKYAFDPNNILNPHKMKL
ncbi:MAG: FAD-binding oxidoreductase [Desulfurella sp.]|uniref:FAD-binding oxidoreductase n=1 Tax=Desulfurella sp. TaxID=1962857 RepID=UPI003D0FC4B1